MLKFCFVRYPDTYHLYNVDNISVNRNYNNAYGVPVVKFAAMLFDLLKIVMMCLKQQFYLNIPIFSVYLHACRKDALILVDEHLNSGQVTDCLLLL
jgi:hypothetical protein